MRSERFAAATGAIYVALIMVGSGLATGNGDPQDGPAILAHLRSGRTPGGTGGGTAVALGAGLVTTAVKLAAATAMLASETHPDQLTPDLARVLNDIGGGGIVVT